MQSYSIAYAYLINRACVSPFIEWYISSCTSFGKLDDMP